ncbi:MAG: hypothetical protein HGA96_08535 [Desulfobulbaceae bacterium]|nr:hypothetical protein [Desulfobulbaceae bacterium]
MQNKLDDSVHGFGAAVKAAFGKTVVGITPTGPDFNDFRGINYGGNLYVNLASNGGFINIAGCQLYHQIERSPRWSVSTQKNAMVAKRVDMKGAFI